MIDSSHEEVIIVDDDIYVQRGLKRLLASCGFSTRIFGSAKEFFESQAPLPAVGCLVLDIEMPGMNGMELQDRLQQRKISLPVIFITGHGTISRSVQAMQRGAVDFFEKPVDSQVLIEAIRQALARSRQQHADMQECLGLQQRFDSLSSRERDVLRLVLKGLLNKQIAAELGIVEQTVKAHRARVMEKMQANSLAELVRMTEMLRLAPCSAPIVPPLG
jgi:FixJ family two-component response regulator